ncbi:hypothetical protein [Lacticaseibacillus salsurivasis]|uniref:hypothetical protein n=1 Tax=Lacticaseibacillus salsurivasis TaxID=3081441 RepID=UPI0030C75061
MNRPMAAMLQRAVQAAILGVLLWASAMAFGWRWLLFVVIVVLIYGLICFGYAIFLWRVNR